MGTRGRSLGGVQGLIPGSVSKYCLQQSPVPVIVVRPSSKREKKKRKRAANTTREKYDDVLRINDAKSGKIFDASMDQAKQKSTAVASASNTSALGKDASIAGDDISALTTTTDTSTTTINESTYSASSGNQTSAASTSSSNTPVPKRPPLAASASASVIATAPPPMTTLTRSNSTHNYDEADKVADAIGLPLNLRRLERDSRGRGRANSLPVVPTVRSLAKQQSDESSKKAETATTDVAQPTEKSFDEEHK